MGKSPCSVAIDTFDLRPAGLAWREDFIGTFLQRDLAQLGVRTPALTLRRFWMMLAHYSGGIWNASEIGRSLGEAHTTVRRRLILSRPGWKFCLLRRVSRS